MAINPVLTSPQSGITNAVNVIANASTSGVVAADTTQTIPATKAAVYERSEQTTNNAKTTYTRDSATLNEISKQVEAKLANLRGIVENLFTMQSVKTGEGKGLSYDQIMEKYDGKLKDFYQNLKVDDATSLKAQQEISSRRLLGCKSGLVKGDRFRKSSCGRRSL